MNKDSNIDTDINKGKSLEKDDVKYSLTSPSNKTSMPKIAGILLIIAGALALVNWLSFFSLDVTTLEPMIDQFKQVDSTITPEQALGFLRSCAAIGCIVSVFPILGGFIMYKKKDVGYSTGV